MGNDPVSDVRRGFFPPHLFETLDSARHARCFAWLQIKIPGLLNEVTTLGNGPPPEGDGPNYSICFFARFFTAALACQRFFHPLLLAGLQIKGVTFHFLDNVFLLYLPLEAAECIFEGLALLQSDFSQTDYTPLLALIRTVLL